MTLPTAARILISPLAWTMLALSPDFLVATRLLQDYKPAPASFCSSSHARIARSVFPLACHTQRLDCRRCPYLASSGPCFGRTLPTHMGPMSCRHLWTVASQYRLSRNRRTRAQNSCLYEAGNAPSAPLQKLPEPSVSARSSGYGSTSRVRANWTARCSS